MNKETPTWKQGRFAIVAKNRHEYTTEVIRRDRNGTLYYTRENGGSSGAHNRQDGDGVWRDHPMEPTREISESEAVRLLIDWGLEDDADERLARKP